MGQNCRSICFTYSALTLHCSYLTLISSYQSQSLAVRAPQQAEVPFPNRESLHRGDRSALGYGILQRLITNSKKIHANVLWHCTRTERQRQCNVGELTVTPRWQDTAHCVAPAQAPGRLQSCSSSGGGRGSGCPEGQGFFSLHDHTQTHTLDLSVCWAGQLNSI